MMKAEWGSTTTTTNFPLSNGIKIISIFQCLHEKIVCTIFIVQKRGRHTNTNKKLNIFGHPGRVRSQGPLGALKIWGKPEHLQLKSPQLHNLFNQILITNTY